MIVQQSRNSRILGSRLSNGGRPCFIFSGQSNVDGARPIAELEAEYVKSYPGVWFSKQMTTLNRIDFVPMDAADEFTYKAGNPNLGGYFCFQFYLYPELKTLLGTDVYIVQHAYGGTGLYNEWKSTATVGYMYTETVFKINAAKNLITGIDGIAPDFKFMFFGQGETDARVEANANAYETNLTNLINNIRSATGLTNLPFLIGRLNPNIVNSTLAAHDYWETVRDAQEATALALDDVYIVDQDNAEMHTDNTHYTAAGYKTIKDNIISVAQTNGLI